MAEVMGSSVRRAKGASKTETGEVVAVVVVRRDVNQLVSRRGRWRQKCLDVCALRIPQ
jgi:hypothetical protein